MSDVPSAIEGGVIRHRQNSVTLTVEAGKPIVLYFSNLSSGEHRLVDLTLKRDASENITTYLGQTNCFTITK